MFKVYQKLFLNYIENNYDKLSTYVFTNNKQQAHKEDGGSISVQVIKCQYLKHGTSFIFIVFFSEAHGGNIFNILA